MNENDFADRNQPADQQVKSVSQDADLRCCICAFEAYTLFCTLPTNHRVIKKPATISGDSVTLPSTLQMEKKGPCTLTTTANLQIQLWVSSDHHPPPPPPPNRLIFDLLLPLVVSFRPPGGRREIVWARLGPCCLQHSKHTGRQHAAHTCISQACLNLSRLCWFIEYCEISPRNAVCVCVRACVRACARSCVPACARASERERGGGLLFFCWEGGGCFCAQHIARRFVLRLLAADDRACTCIPATQTIGELPSRSQFSVISVITKKTAGWGKGEGRVGGE